MGATAERASPPDRIVVIGVGNPLRGDDGVGTAVVDVLAADPCPVARLAVCDGEPARLIELWDGAELAVVLDAVRVPPERAGRLHRLRLTGNGASAPGEVTVEPTAAGSHGLGLGHALALATVLGRGAPPPRPARDRGKRLRARTRTRPGRRRGRPGSRGGGPRDRGPAPRGSSMTVGRRAVDPNTSPVRGSRGVGPARRRASAAAFRRRRHRMGARLQGRLPGGARQLQEVAP